MEQQDPADKAPDGSSHQSRRSSKSEKSSDKVQRRDGGKDRLPPSMVRGGNGGSGEYKASDADIDAQQVTSKKRISLQDYQLTAKTARAIERLNTKGACVSSTPTTAARAAPSASATHGISPSRSSPSPPRTRDVFSVDSNRDIGNKFGFYDFGPNDPQFSSGNSRHNAEDLRQVDAEQKARAALNHQAELLMHQAAVGGQHQRVSAGGEQRGLHEGRGQAPWPGLQGQYPAPRPDLSGAATSTVQMPQFMLEVMYKLGEVQAKVEQTNRQPVDKQSGDQLDKAPTQPDQRTIPAVDSDVSPSESEEEIQMDWSGQPIDSRSSEIQISEPALDFWSSLVGVDEKGMREFSFKNLSKNPKKVKQFIEGKKSMNPQEIETEIPRLWGHHLKTEVELSAAQKVVGATAAATCVAVDAARHTVDDLRATVKDFEDGVFDDPSAEATKLCGALADLLEDKIIANSIQALRFTASSFCNFTAKRRSLALRQVSDLETKRVLEKTPPSADFLFGGKVKESIQQSRDSNQIKRAFQRPRDSKPRKYSNSSYQKDKGSKGSDRFFRPMSDRFKGGDRKWKNKKDLKGKKRKDAKDDE